MMEKNKHTFFSARNSNQTRSCATLGLLASDLTTGPLGIRKHGLNYLFLTTKTTPRTAPKTVPPTLSLCDSKFQVYDYDRTRSWEKARTNGSWVPSEWYPETCLLTIFFSLPTFAQGFVPCTKVQWVFKYEGDAVGAHGARDPSVSPLSPVPPLPVGSAHGGTFPSNDSVAAEAHATQRKPLSERKQVAMATEEKGCVCRFFFFPFSKKTSG